MTDLTSQTPEAETRRPLSVLEAVTAAKGALEATVVTLMGEVSEVSDKPGYKAVYFTVKDEKASLPCMMWMGRYHASGIALQVGMVVELTGRFTLYVPKGRMNFEVFSLSLAGEGRLRYQVAQLASKLEAEGLMDPARKRAVPAFPTHVGVVTSPRGDAVHDVLRTLRRRFPAAKVSVAGVPVEGRDAPQHLIEGLRACYRARCEVILLVRGGGSFEDLMPFNDEKLARAIVACPIPVVTGIGHEPDTTIADMVADLRQSTPTGAATAVSPDADGLIASLGAAASKLSGAMGAVVMREQARLGRYEASKFFADPHSLLQTDALTIDMLHARLSAALPRSLQADTQRLSHAQARLEASLAQSVDGYGLRVFAADARLHEAGRHVLDAFSHDFALRAGRLHDLSPLAILSRGYAMATSDAGHVVKSVEGLSAGDPLHVTVADGVVHCAVVSTDHSDESDPMH